MTFRSKFGRGLVAAMEDEALAADLAEVDTGADSAEAAVAEVTEIGGDIEAAAAEIESASTDAETLDTIADKVEATEVSGGLTPEAAEVVEVAVEAIYARMGIDRKPIPALEGFSNKDSRVKTTHIAVEDWRAKAKQIWKAIVDAFNRVLTWIKDFINGIKDANVRLGKRANAVLSSLKGKTGEAKAATISGAGIAKKLIGKIKTGDGGGITSLDLVKTTDAAFAVVANLGYQAKSLNAGDAVKSQEAFDKWQIEPLPGKKSEIKAPDGLQWIDAADFGGNKTLSVLSVVEIKAGADAFAAASKVKAQLVPTLDDKEAGVGADELATLSLDDIKAVANEVLKTTTFINGKGAAVAEVEGNLKKFIQDAKTAEAASEKDEATAQRAKAVASAGSALHNVVIKAVALSYSTATSVAQGALDYAEKSLKQYADIEKAK